MTKNKLNVVSNSTTSNASPMKTNPRMSEGEEARERKYKAEDALRDLERAETHKNNKDLMKDVKQLAKQKMKCLDKI